MKSGHRKTAETWRAPWGNPGITLFRLFPAIILLAAAYESGAQTFYWNRNDVLTYSSDFTKTYNWSSNANGSGYRPKSLADDDFTPDALGGIWSAIDLDNDAGTGAASTTANADQLTLTGRGSDVWGATNQFYGVHRGDIAGDFDVTVKVNSLTNTHAAAKSGIIIANNFGSLASGGFAFLAARPDGSVEYTRDVSGTIGELETTYATGVNSFPVYLRLVKLGPNLSAYYKTALGNTWAQVATSSAIQTLTGDIPTQVGLFVCSHNAASTATAVFDDFQGGTNFAPGTGYDLSFGGSGGGAATDALITGPVDAASIDLTGWSNSLNFGRANGLAATIFDNIDFTGTVVTRMDSVIDFNWSSGPPHGSIGADDFSIRWEGMLDPQYSETYTFYTTFDDGERLWVNNVLVVDSWASNPAEMTSATLNLTAGQKVPIRLEYYEGTGNAVARLQWSSPSTPKAIVPNNRLYASRLSLTGNANFGSPATLVPGVGLIELTGPGAQTLTPSASQGLPAIAKIGGGTTTLATNNLTAGSVTVSGGTLDLSTRSLTTNGSLSITNGALTATNGTVTVNGDFLLSGGSISMPSGNFNVSGNVTRTAGTATHNNGTLNLTGSGAGKTFDFSPTLYDLNVNNNGGSWTMSGNPFTAAGIFQIQAGTVNLGAALTHSAGTFSAASGSLDFNSSTLNVTSGNAVFSGLSALTAGSGTLGFTAATGTQSVEARASTTHPHIIHSGAGTLRLMNASMTALSFQQTAGAFDFNNYNFTTVSSGNFTVTNGNSGSILNPGGRILTVAGNLSLSGASSTDRLALNPTFSWYVRVTGTANVQLATLRYADASAYATVACGNCANAGDNTNATFATAWDGGGGDANWTTAANWGSDAVPTSVDAITFNATSANATLDAAATVKSITFTSGYTGTFSFSSNTLTVDGGGADFRSGGAIAAGTGTLAFTGGGSQSFIPKSGATFPAINHNSNAGTTTVTTHPLTAGNLTLGMGTFNLGAGMTHSVGSILGGGGIDFGTSNLDVAGNVDLSAHTVTATSANTLTFTGSAAQTYTPNVSEPDLNLTQNGSGGTTVATNNFTTPTLTIAAGTFNLGTSRQHVATNLVATGGGLDFGTGCYLDVSGATVDLSALATLTPGTGYLRFAGSGAQTFVPKDGATHPSIWKNGSGTTTVSTYNLTAGSLVPTGGTFHMGAGLNHAFTSTSPGGGPYGSIHFGSSQVHFTGHVSLDMLSTVTAGTGTLHFDAPTGTQTFSPKSGTTLGAIVHAGAGTLQLATNNLACASFTQTGGPLDLNGRNLQTAGDFTVTGGNATSFTGLAGRTLTVGGNASLAGASSGSLLNLNPGSAWTLAVTGSLNASLAALSNGNASISAGICTNCSDGGGNSNWTTAVSWDGGGADNNWTTTGNWGLDAVPTSADHVVFDATSVKNATLDATGNVASIRFTSGYTGTFSFVTNNVVIHTGNADMRSGGAFSAGSGLLYFQGTGAQTLIPPASGTLPRVQRTFAGTLTFSTHNYSGAGIVVSAGAINLGAGLSHTATLVDGNSGATLDFGTSHLIVPGGGTVDFADMTVTAAGSNTVTFSGATAMTYIPRPGLTTLGILQTGTGTTTVTTNDFSAPTFSISAGTFLLGTSRSHAIATFTAGGGTLDFGSSTLTFTGSSLDLSGLAGITPGTGNLSLSSSGGQVLVPKSGATLPALTKVGAGTLSLSTNAMVAGDLNLSAGGINLGSSLTHTVNSVFGAGSLDFGTSNLNALGNVNLSAGTVTATSGNTLAFTGSSAQTYTPNASEPDLNLTQNGTGGTTALAVFTTPTLTITSGTLSLGTGYGHTAGTFSAAGGGLDFGSSSLMLTGPTQDFSALGTLVANAGTLVFTGASAQSFTPKASHTYPAIVQNGTGGTTLATNNLTAGTLSIDNGILNLGPGRSHTVASISSSNGGLNFNSSTLSVTSGNAMLDNLGTVTAGTGTLAFTAASGTQVLTPKLGQTHPAIVHSGAGTLQIATRDLICASFSHSAGVMDFNGRNLSTVSAGDFTVTAGTSSTFAGLAGRTLTVAGNASLSGASAADKLNLNPASAWTLAVTGTLSAAWAAVMNGAAAASAGSCTDCANGGGNSNWNFLTSWDGGGADNNWTTAGNWGSDAVPTSADDIVFNGTSVKDATLDAAATVKSITFTTGYTGAFSFGSGTLTIGGGNADFRSGGTFVAGTGSLAFTSATAQSFIPRSGAAFPAIVQNGTGGTTVTTNALQAGDLTLTSGAFRLGTALNHSVAGISGSGTLDFGTANLSATGNVNLSAATVTAASGNVLTFANTAARTYTPNASATGLHLTFAGTGAVAVLTNGFTTPALTLSAGSLTLGSGLLHEVTGTLSIGGGGLDLNAGVLRTASATVDLRGLASLAGSGTLELNGGTAQILHPRAATLHPNVAQKGTGGTTIASNSLQAGTLSIEAGILDLGSAFTHEFSGIATLGGGLNFNSSALRVTCCNADFSGLATLNPGTGSLQFTSATGTQILTPRSGSALPALVHGGGSTLRLATYDVTAPSFLQSAGVLDFNGRNLSTTGDFTVSNGHTASFTGLGGRTLAVGGNAAIAGQNGNLANLNPASAWTLSVTGTLSATLAQIANCNASQSPGDAMSSTDLGGNANWAFSVTWDGGGADGNWSTGANWSGDAAPGSGTKALFDATSTKSCVLDGAVTVKALLMGSGYTGTFSFATNTLNVTGNADFRSGGPISAGSGTLAFAGSGPQSFIPKAGATFPGITQNGAGGTTVSTHALTAGSLNLMNGAFALGSGFTHAVSSVGGAGGSLDFGGSTLQVSGNADLSALAAVVAGTGILELTGGGAQTLSPKAGATHPRLAKTGTGTATVIGAGLTTAGLRISGGTLNLGTGLIHAALDSLRATGGTIDFGSSTLRTGAVSPNLGGLAGLIAGTGTLEFNGGSAQTFTPKAGMDHPALVQNGAGGTTVAGSGLQSGMVTIALGALNLGAGLAHAVGGFASTGGTLDFGSSTVATAGSVNLGGLGTLIAGTGTLSFTAAAGTQVFVPKGGAVHPLLTHPAAGTVQLSGSSLEARGYQQTAGAIDLNGFNLTLSASGSLAVSGAALPILGLSGRTLTVTGNARFAGTPATPVDLNPASAWNLAVTGSLTAVNARIRNSMATLATGIADSSLNQGGNSGWTFVDSIKPDNVSGFLASAIPGNRVALAWTASASGDADSVMLRYRTDGTYPTSRTDGTLWGRVKADRTADTATGLPDKTIYHFAAFVKDSSGNYSLATTTSRDSARLPDITPPANVTAFAANGLSATVAALAWIPSASTDADSVMIRYRTGPVHPTGPADGSLWGILPAAADKDTLTGLASNTLYAFSLFVRDSSGNYSPAAAAAQDTSLFQLPVSGSVSVADVAGRTRDGDPALAFTWSGADSVRFASLPDTAAAPWKAVRSADSLDLGIADGQKVVAAQFKNLYGKRSPWYRDTTVVDRKAPVVTLDLKADMGRWTWPQAVSGLSRDSLSGTDMVFVVRRRLADGFHFNGVSWQAAADTARLLLSAGDTLFSAALPATALTAGDYQFTAFARDRAGNLGLPVVQAVHYEANRPAALAYSNMKDTVPQNQAVAWKLDFGDLDAGDSLVPVSFEAPAWLTAAPAADTAWAPWALHRTYSLTGTPAQGDVGANVVRVRLQDRGGLILTHADTVLISDVNDPPVFADSQAAYSVKEDSLSIWTPRFADVDPGDRHTLTLLSGPAFAKVESLSVALKPGSRDVGPHTVLLTLSDGALLDTLRTVLTVVNVNDRPYAFASTGFMSPAFFREDRPDSFSVVVVDLDRHEPIVFAGQMPAWMKMSTAIDTTGYNRTFTFRVNPTPKDTGLFSMALTFMDPAQAVAQLALAGRILPDNDTPTAVVEDPRTHGGAARFRLSVLDEDGSLEQARFHYRLVGPSGDTVRRGITSSSLLSLHPLADGNYRLAVRAEDQDGLRQAAFTVVPFGISGATTLSLDTARWHMVGPQQALLPASSFGAGATLATWDEAGDDGQPLARYTSGKAVETLKRGKGYWVRLAGPVTLAAAQKDLLEGPASLKLTRAKQGWNQVANPYPYWVDLSASRLTFWEWDAEKRDLVNVRGLLKPWAAYWVLAPKDTTVQIADAPYFPAPQGALAKSAAAGGPVAAFKHREDWSVQLGLRAGRYHDQANVLGVHAKGAAGTAGSATAAMDQPRVLADAPKYGDYLSFHFESPASKDTAAQGFAQDIRNALHPEEEWWDFSVENRGTGETQALLMPAGLEGLASDGLRLFLVKQGEARLVEPGQAVTLSVEEERTHYSLVVTPHADFAGRLKGNFSISQNFPNPVTTFTSFRFVLPQSWDREGKRVARDFNLRIKVYDYSGREVAKAVDGKFRPGTHVLRWTPVTPSGRPLAKGAYVYRLETAGFVKSRKMVVK